MKHIVLLGDSIFDNKSYVNPIEPSCIGGMKMEMNNI